MDPRTKYAKSGEVSIAYQAIGDGPVDIVHIPGLLSHIDLGWEYPGYRRFTERLAAFARVLVYDKRGYGLSDPVTEPPSVEERIDDTRAVMDAEGVDRAVVFGWSEGASLAAFFAASYPQRVSQLILYGSFVRLTLVEGYPSGPLDEEDFIELMDEAIEAWGEGVTAITLAPSLIGTEQQRWWGRLERATISPRSWRMVMAANLKLDVRDVLPVVGAPTLVIHRTDDTLPIEGGRYVAERIPGARFVELDGDGHVPWVDDVDSVCDEIEEFVTGERPAPEPNRVLATVLFTDIVGSTERATELGDRAWRELLDAHEDFVRAEVERHSGREIKTTGNGVLATFDGPARGIRCATAIAEQASRSGFQIRAGLHTGECELRKEDIGGIAVHIGARVMSTAGPGEVVVSSTVKDLTVGSDIEFADRGAHELKGVPGEWRLYAVER